LLILKRSVFAIAGVGLLALAGLAAAIHRDSDPRELALENGSIVFVCLNGVAMSVWSARTFDRLAAERGLPVRAISRASAATFDRVPLRMRLALWLDGYRLGGYEPRVISAADVRGAERVILIDTELPPSAFTPDAAIETWSGFPAMREKYFASRAALRTRVEALVVQLAASRSKPTRGES
jgi:hypothetical protein